MFSQKEISSGNVKIISFLDDIVRRKKSLVIFVHKKHRDRIQPQVAYLLKVSFDDQGDLVINIVKKRGLFRKQVAVFNPYLNRYMEEQNSKIRIKKGYFWEAGYEIYVRSEYRGDFLILRNRKFESPKGKIEAVFQHEIVINLWAIFMFEIYEFTSDGKINLGEEQKASLDLPGNCFFPFIVYFGEGSDTKGIEQFICDSWKKSLTLIPQLEYMKRILNNHFRGETSVKYEEVIEKLK